MNWRYLSRYRTELMGFSCICIMLFHNFIQWKVIGNCGYYIQTLFARGNVGVDCFLFLSGIGLYHSFSKRKALNNGVTVLSFYKKRLVRLLVPYIVIAVPGYAVLTRAEDFWESVFQINFIKTGANLTWFIPFIMLMYLFFPLIYYFQNEEMSFKGRVFKRNNITVLMCVLYYVVLVMMQKYLYSIYQNTEVALTRGIIFILGCHCAKYVKEERAIPNGTVLFSASFILIYIFSFLGQNKLAVMWTRLTYVPFSIAVLMVVSYSLDKISKITNKAHFGILCFFGERSLELYLTHVILKSVYLRYLGVPHFEATALVDYGVVLLAAIVISSILHPLFNSLIHIVDKSIQ